MYAGTGNPPGAGPSVYGVWKTDGTGSAPYQWTESSRPAALRGQTADYAMSLQIFADPTYCPGIGCLYVGTDRPNEIVRIHPDTTGKVPVDAVDSWDLVVGNPRTIPPGYTGAGLLSRRSAASGNISTTDSPGTSGEWEWADRACTWALGTGAPTNYIQPTFAPFQSQEFGTDLWRTPDGVHWPFVSKVGLGRRL